MNHSNLSTSGAFGSGTAQLSVVPFSVVKGIMVEKLVLRLGPWASPLFQGLLCRNCADPGKQLLKMVHEMPYPLISQIAPTNRPDLERLHIERFCTDYCLGAGERPYWDIGPGGNPPDFHALSNDGERRIDCTQFTVEKRRQVHALFRLLKEAVLEAERKRFSHLFGLLIYV